VNERKKTAKTCHKSFQLKFRQRNKIIRQRQMCSGWIFCLLSSLFFRRFFFLFQERKLKSNPLNILSPLEGFCECYIVDGDSDQVIRSCMAVIREGNDEVAEILDMIV
jgi:hypothetical protein